MTPNNFNYTQPQSDNRSINRSNKKQKLKSILEVVFSPKESEEFVSSLLAIFRIQAENEDEGKKIKIKEVKKNPQTNLLLSPEASEKRKVKYSNLANENKVNELDVETDYEYESSANSKIENFEKDLLESIRQANRG
jgi:hypothetical protein